MFGVIGGSLGLFVSISCIVVGLLWGGLICSLVGVRWELFYLTSGKGWFDMFTWGLDCIMLGLIME